jgi:hypothetical protein
MEDDVGGPFISTVVALMRFDDKYTHLRLFYLRTKVLFSSSFLEAPSFVSSALQVK